MADGWHLAIDFGTTNTAAAVMRDGADEAELVRFDPGDGGPSTPYMPSAVMLGEDGEIVVGHAAERAIPAAPERGQRTPKAKLRGGHVVETLGGESVPVIALVEAVIAAAFARACEQMGGEPRRVALTCPVAWAPEGKQWRALRAAANLAGIVNALVMPEPEAAAQHVGLSVAPLEEGAACAVYDLGGGTCDIAVLRRAGDRMQPVAMSEDDVGGELFDELLYTDVLAALGQVDGDSARRIDGALWEEPESVGALAETAAWRRCQADLSLNVRRAKEALSERERAHVLVPPPVGREFKVSRARFEYLIRSDVERTVAQLGDCVRRALPDGSGDGLASVYVVGASSQIPAIAAGVESELGRPALLPDEPKGAIALGAVRALARRVSGLTTVPPPPPPPAPLRRSSTAEIAVEERVSHLGDVLSVRRSGMDLVVLRALPGDGRSLARLDLASGRPVAEVPLPPGGYEELEVGEAGVVATGPFRAVVLDHGFEALAQRDGPVFARVGRDVAWIAYFGEGERVATRMSRRVLRPLRLRTFALGATPHVVEDLHLGEVSSSHGVQFAQRINPEAAGEPPPWNATRPGRPDADGLFVQLQRPRRGRIGAAWSQDCVYVDARGAVEPIASRDVPPWALAQHRLGDALLSLVGREPGEGPARADAGRAPGSIVADDRTLFQFGDPRLELSMHATPRALYVLVRNPAPPASGGGWLELYACDAAGCERVYRSETAVAELIEWDEAGCWLWEWREGDGRSIGVRVEPGAEVQRVTLEQGPGVVPIAAEGGRLYALVRAPDGPHELVSYTWRAT